MSLVSKLQLDVEPWPNGSQCTFPTCIQLAFRLTTLLRWLELLSPLPPTDLYLESTLPFELKFFVRKSTQVFHRLVTQRKSTQLVGRKPSVYAWNLRLYATCELASQQVRLAIDIIASPLYKFWFCKLASTCIDLRVRLAREKGAMKRFRSQIISPTFKRWKGASKNLWGAFYKTWTTFRKT